MPLQRHLRTTLLPGLIALMILLPDMAEAAPGLRITQAQWSKTAGMLTVRGVSDAGGPVSLYDPSGRLLGTANPEANQRFKLKIADQWPELLCRVRAKAGDQQVSRVVNGVPNKDCGKVPQCRIISPTGGLAVKANEDVSFKATAKLKDKKAGPLTLDWDFAGGSMGELLQGSNPPTFLRPHGETTTVQFVRDNSRYRVRFTAYDGQRRYCEDAIDVIVGSPPETPPGVPLLAAQAVAERSKPGSAASRPLDGVVVLPYEQWTMQSDHDMRILPNAYVSMSPTIHNLLSVVYQKGVRPQRLGNGDVKLNYRASSNPFDPVGLGSINSTSQNWPLNEDIKVASPLATAQIKKTQLWEKYKRPDSEKSTNYYMSSFWAAFGSTYPFSGLPESGNPEPDEGYVIGRGMADVLSGSYMPGKNNPYVVNESQPFSDFNSRKWEFMAKLLPYSDIDDNGRVNPFPLLKVEVEKEGVIAASTDAVMNVSRDFHCRECHTKGGIAANPNSPFTKEAFGSSAGGKLSAAWGGSVPKERPEFYDAASDSIWDQEYAAMQNYSSLHSFYNDDFVSSVVMEAASVGEDGKVEVDAPVRCTGCHNTGMIADSSNFNEGWYSGNDHDTTSAAYGPNYSIALHRFHGELQWNESKTDILRDESGRFVRWDWKSKGRNTKSLFPVMDEQGRQMPTEQNCLRCHAGHREQQHRDRMFTAGSTCFDCHGDMLAVGQAFPKNFPKNQEKLGSNDLNDYRVMWFDEPDCGSCHLGDGNIGKNAEDGYYSAAVMRRAFPDDDLSATPRPVDRGSIYGSRFSAAPIVNYRNSFITSICDSFDWNLMEFGCKTGATNVDAPLYREGVDAHGNVPCAACHGSAHAIWPNHDPKANDNQTALQLQGFSGPIMECKVCHSDDSFIEYKNLDGGRFTGLPEDSGMLGGPHGMHPMRDENWWKQAKEEIVQGGWHDNVYRNPGRNGEDQCAACHGTDHKGTRLSKTPVDLSFDLGNGRVAKWKAGDQIGCNQCHSLEKSFRNGPTGTGKPGGGGAENRPPVITSLPESGAKPSDIYTYQVLASDPENNPLTFGIESEVENMTIDAKTGLVTWQTPEKNGGYNFVVFASDGVNKTTQQVRVGICTPPLMWHPGHVGGSCSEH